MTPAQTRVEKTAEKIYAEVIKAQHDPAYPYMPIDKQIKFIELHIALVLSHYSIELTNEVCDRLSNVFQS